MWKGNPATDALEICTFSWNNMEAACYILKEFVLRAQSDSAERKQMLEPKTRNSCGYQTINWRKYIYHVSLFLNYECISQEQDMLRSFIFGSCFLLQWQFQSVQSIQIQAPPFGNHTDESEDRGVWHIRDDCFYLKLTQKERKVQHADYKNSIDLGLNLSWLLHTCHALSQSSCFIKYQK